jgi:MoxR-like ATPase
MSLTINQVKFVLDHIIENNRFLEKHGKKKNAILIESMPGIGKTSLVEQIAHEKNLSFVKINLSNIEQAGDICGFPIREFQRSDGSWENEKSIQYSLNKFPLNGSTRTSYCPPAWVPDGTKGTILCLDDFTRAPMHIMQAVMEIIDKQEFISWKLPKDCHIIMTSNPSDTGDFFVTSLDSAQQTRYIRLKMDFNICILLISKYNICNLNICTLNLCIFNTIYLYSSSVSI